MLPCPSAIWHLWVTGNSKRVFLHYAAGKACIWACVLQKAETQKWHPSTESTLLGIPFPSSTDSRETKLASPDSCGLWLKGSLRPAVAIVPGLWTGPRNNSDAKVLLLAHQQRRVFVGQRGLLHCSADQDQGHQRSKEEGGRRRHLGHGKLPGVTDN